MRRPITPCHSANLKVRFMPFCFESSFIDFPQLDVALSQEVQMKDVDTMLREYKILKAKHQVKPVLSNNRLILAYFNIWAGSSIFGLFWHKFCRCCTPGWNGQLCAEICAFYVKGSESTTIFTFLICLDWIDFGFSVYLFPVVVNIWNPIVNCFSCSVLLI